MGLKEKWYEPFDRLRALSEAEAALTPSSQRENQRNGSLVSICFSASAPSRFRDPL